MAGGTLEQPEHVIYASQTSDEEDYDNIPPFTADTLVMRRKREPPVNDDNVISGTNKPVKTLGSINIRCGVLADWSEDAELRDVLTKGLKQSSEKLARPLFRELVFTRQFSAFDKRNASAASSPFHGFFTLFWMGLGVFVFKIAAENWRNTGNVLGSNEIMKNMLNDLPILLLLDVVMVSSITVSWAIQLLVYHEYLNWDRSGWIIQNIWQVIFLIAIVGIPLLRPWPWTHVTFFVLHGLIFLMKHHSYAFYNGYLSKAYKKRRHLQAKLKQLEALPLSDTLGNEAPLADATGVVNTKCTSSVRQRRPSLHVSNSVDDDLAQVSNDIAARRPLHASRLRLYEDIIRHEIDALSDIVRGRASAEASPSRAYPANLTLVNAAEWCVLPTLVYELDYPRAEAIDWRYFAEKVMATAGIILVMIIISQARLYPAITQALQLKEQGVPLATRLRLFPWLLLDVVMPFMMEYLLAWYLIWEATLNALAEVTFFADRNFYADWWNSVSWDQFARDWNRPVHHFLLRHVYHSSISSLKVGKHAATLITFLLSALVHELVMWCIFKKLRGYLLILQMCQLPLVSLSRTRLMRGRRTLGNMMFWLGLSLGPSFLCSLYVIL